MKQMILVLAMFGASTSMAGDSYCSGYGEGFKEGYCHEQGYGCIEPITPICPIPEIGEEGFHDGYNRGFLYGLEKERKERTGRY